MKLCESELAPLKQSKYESSYIHLAADRFIFLKEPVTKELASELAALLLYYDNENPKEDITLYIHSNGGDADGLINIYDVMHMIKAPIQTICLGKAYSAAAVMLAAGAKGKRYAFKNSKIMIHGVQFVFPIPGEDQVNSKNYFNFVKLNNDNIMKMLAADTGHTLEKIKEDCKRDLFLDAKEALAYGIIDHIL
jgi:ATP-dependent Clp protease protease subunit